MPKKAFLIQLQLFLFNLNSPPRHLTMCRMRRRWPPTTNHRPIIITTTRIWARTAPWTASPAITMAAAANRPLPRTVSTRPIRVWIRRRPPTVWRRIRAPLITCWTPRRSTIRTISSWVQCIICISRIICCKRHPVAPTTMARTLRHQLAQWAMWIQRAMTRYCPSTRLRPIWCSRRRLWPRRRPLQPPLCSNSSTAQIILKRIFLIRAHFHWTVRIYECFVVFKGRFFFTLNYFICLNFFGVRLLPDFGLKLKMRNFVYFS